jgi:transcriptional regulator GlxA family with amidase domain
VSYDHTLLFKGIALTLEGDPFRSLSDLSRDLQVSRRTIQNAVYVVTGKKFRDLREEFLLARIKKLLVSAPNTTIRKVSWEAGFKSPRSFSRAVRRICGLTPQELRNRVASDLCKKNT